MGTTTQLFNRDGIFYTKRASHRVALHGLAGECRKPRKRASHRVALHGLARECGMPSWHELIHLHAQASVRLAASAAAPRLFVFASGIRTRPLLSACTYVRL